MQQQCKVPPPPTLHVPSCTDQGDDLSGWDDGHWRYDVSLWADSPTDPVFRLQGLQAGSAFV